MSETSGEPFGLSPEDLPIFNEELVGVVTRYQAKLNRAPIGLETPEDVEVAAGQWLEDALSRLAYTEQQRKFAFSLVFNKEEQ